MNGSLIITVPVTGPPVGGATREPCGAAGTFTTRLFRKFVIALVTPGAALRANSVATSSANGDGLSPNVFAMPSRSADAISLSSFVSFASIDGRAIMLFVYHFKCADVEHILERITLAQILSHCSCEHLLWGHNIDCVIVFPDMVESLVN